MHYIPIIDAGVSASEKNGTYIPYDEGVQRKIFVLDERENVPFVGKVWNLGFTVWPDFTNPDTLPYYKQMMGDLYKNFEYDGAWIVSSIVKFYDVCQIFRLINSYYELFLGYERTIKFL